MTIAPPTLKVEIDFTGNPTAGHADILDGLDDVVSFWRMNSTSTFVDENGANSGTIEGTPTTTASPLTYDSDLALQFDGTADAAYVPTSAGLTSKGNMMIAGWLRVDTLPGATKLVVGKQGAWTLSVTSAGKLVWMLKDDTSTATVTTTSSLVASTWYHVAAVYDSVNISVYLNSVLDNQTAFTSGWEAGSQPIRFGASASTSSPTWQSTQTATSVSASPTANMPVSTASGDLLLAHMNIASASATFTAAPTGWLLLASDATDGFHRCAIYYKIATGSEPASYSWTLSGSSGWSIAISRFTGIDSVAPFANPVYLTATASGTSHSTGTHVPNVDNNMVLAMFSLRPATSSWTESSGTERYDVSGGSQGSVAMSTQTQASATSLSVTGTSSTSSTGTAALVVLCGAGRTYAAVSMKDWSFWSTAPDEDQIAQLYESRNSGEGTWVDVTSQVKSVDTKGCGRQYELDRIEAGTATVVFTDRNRVLDPTNTSSAYYPNVKKNRKIRITATFSAVSYPIFKGFIERYTPDWYVPRYAETTITASDGFKPLNQAGISGTNPVAFSGAQIDRILDLALWPVADRAIDTGSYVMAAATIAVGTKAKAEIDAVVDSELGVFFVDANGDATFHDSAHRGSQTRSTASQASFTWSGGGGVLYQELSPSDDSDKIVNNWIVSPDSSAPGAAAQEVIDHSSVAENWIITQTRDTRLASNTDALSQANQLLNEKADTSTRFDSITVIPTTTTGFQETLTATISDRVTVTASPGLTGTSITKDCFVEGTGSWSILPGPTGSWKVSFPLSPVSAGNYYDTIVRGDPVSYWRMDTVS